MDETNEAGVEAEESRAPETDGVEAEGSVSSADAQDDTNWEEIANNYKAALQQKRQLRNHVPTPELEEQDDSKPLTRKDIEEIISQKVVPLVSTSKEDMLLTQKISDPSKREYVKQLLATRIVRTGTSEEDIKADIEDAIAMADRKKTDKTIAELRRAANNRPQAPSAGSSSDSAPEQKQYKWTKEQASALEKKARQLNVDPEKFKKDVWENQSKTKVLR